MQYDEDFPHDKAIRFLWKFRKHLLPTQIITLKRAKELYQYSGDLTHFDREFVEQTYKIISKVLNVTYEGKHVQYFNDGDSIPNAS